MHFDIREDIPRLERCRAAPTRLWAPRSFAPRSGRWSSSFPPHSFRLFLRSAARKMGLGWPRGSRPL
eukprot:3174649-Rhodomonas_salina.1